MTASQPLAPSGPLTRGPGFGTVSADCMNKLEADTRDLCAVREFLEPPISGGNR